MLSNIEKINEKFKLPIYYDKNKQKLNSTIIKDLELNETYDISGTPIYNHIFNTKTIMYIFNANFMLNLNIW
jgi:3'-phosphoadenosine 5'-phosphosulfate sulfotransferase